MHMQPSYPFFLTFSSTQISSHYAAIIPIFLTFSSTQISSHYLSCICSHHTHFSHIFLHPNIFPFSLMCMQPTCMLVPKVFNTWWFPNSLPPNHSIPSPRSYMATFGMQSHHHISSFLILHILILNI